MSLTLMVVLLASAGLRAPDQQPSPEEAVLEAVESFFQALQEKDAEGLREVVAPQARIMGIRLSETGPDLQVTDFQDFIARVVESDVEMKEDDFDVRVEVRGDLANVWQEFNFFMDGRLTQCGTEAIHLLRFPDGWKILHLSETIRSEGCEVRTRGGADPIWFRPAPPNR